MRSERERLLDILEAVERIEKYASRGKSVFQNDELIQNWIVNHLTVIGEACHALSSEFQGRYAVIPWADVIAMRNILVHHYFGIDTEAVWQVVERDIPDIKRNILVILSEVDKDMGN